MTPLTTEAFEDVLEGLTDLPAAVHSWQTEVGEDSTGQLAAWVWAILPDSTDEEWPDFDTLERLRIRIRDAVMQRMGDRIHWVYVNFRGASEVIEE